MPMPPKFVLPLLIPVCVAILTGLSCSGVRAPARAVPEAKMVDLYARILVIQEEGRIRGADSVAVIGRTDSVCASYGVTRGQMQSELEYRSEEHTSELQSPYVISYAVFCLKKTT